MSAPGRDETGHQAIGEWLIPTATKVTISALEDYISESKTTEVISEAN